MIKRRLIFFFFVFGLVAGLWPLSQHPAIAQAQYKVGDRVAAPIGAQFYDSVVLATMINVDQIPVRYQVHPIGYAATDDFVAFPQMLQPCGSVQTQPLGGVASDPYLKAAQGLPPCSPLPVPSH